MEKMREEFVELLVRYRQIKAHDITVVFDGYRNGAGVENTTVHCGVRVIYSRLGERADDVIKRIVSRERREWIVVSSDRDIANHAWAEGSIPVQSERFFEIVSKQVKMKGDAAPPVCEDSEGPPPFAADDEAEDPRCRKGNPYKLSKRDRAVRKALSKL